MNRDELLGMYRQVLDVNNQLTELKEQTEVREKEYQAIINKASECKSKWGTGTFVKCLLPALLLILVGIVTLISVFDRDMWSLIPIAIFMIIFLLGLVNLIATMSFAKHDRDRNEIEAAKILNEEAVPAYEEYQKSVKRLQKKIQTSNIERIEARIPEDYRTQNALKFFVKALENGRADTEKELYNLYEEELHRMRLEKIEEEKLEKLEASLTHCPKCGSTNCQMMIKTETESSNFSFLPACLGWLVGGPILACLCSQCGTGTSTKSENYWVCNDCGKKFTK